MPVTAWLLTLGVALAQEAPAPGWVLERWTTEDGLPIDHLNGLALDARGALWIASFDGLIRFDGQTPEVLRAGHPLGPPSDRVLYLALHPVDGALWLQDEQLRLQRRGPDSLQTFDDPEQRAQIALHQGADSVWTVIEGAPARLDEQPGRVEWPGEHPQDLMPDRDGSLALWTQDGRHWRRDPEGRWSEAPKPDIGGQPLLARYRDGGLGLQVHGREAWRWDDASQAWLSEPEPVWVSITQDQVRSPWGVARDNVIVHGESAVLKLEDRLEDIEVQGDCAWLSASGGGLRRLCPEVARAVRAPDGERSNVLRLWWEDPTQTLWALSDDQGWWPVLETTAPTLPALPETGCYAWASRYFTDADGDRALTCIHGVWYWEDGAWRPDPVDGEGLREGPVWQTGGHTWLGGVEHLHVSDGDEWRVIEGPEGALRQVYALLEHPDGGVLVGSHADGVWRVPEGVGPATRVPALEGLEAVRHLRWSGDALVLATQGQGLCVAPAGAAPRCLGSDSPLKRSTFHASIEDDQGRTWISSNQGLGVLETQALMDFAAGGEAPAALWLDIDDGLRSAELNGHYGDAVVRTPDGRLWFASQDGVVSVRPEDLRLPEPPGVLWLDAQVGDSFTPEPLALALPTTHAPLTLRWTTPTRRWADQIEFRYRMGPTRPWSAASRERRLELATLPPGETRLEVQARLGGAWGPSTVLPIQRTPALRERAVFPLLLGLLSLGGLVAVFATRSVLQARAKRHLEVTVAEQTQELASQNQALAVQSEALRARNAEIAAQAEELQELDRLKRQLIANLSHELRTPLSLVMAPLSRMRAQAEGKEAQHLQLALDSAEQLQGLIGQLFDLSRAQAGGLKLRVRKVDLIEITEETLRRFDPAAEARGVTLALEAPTSLPPLWLDRDLLEKVLGNLISNALRFSPEGGTLRVELDAEPEQARVAVQDEGPGVPEAHAAQIFERFYQVEEAGQRPAQGAGIGLALVKELVELHGGEVGLGPSEAGARFWFTLPVGMAHLAPEEVSLADPEAAEPLPANDAVEEPSEGGARVLLVEDHPQLRGYLADCLSERYTVIQAVDGVDALERFAEGPVDLVISDIMMPRLDGHGLVKRLRAMPGGERLPILFVSARQELQDTVEGLELADDYLAKPFRTPELMARAAALLRRGPTGAEPVAPEGPDPAARFVEALQERARLSEDGFGVAELAKAMAMSPRTLQLRMQEHALPTPVVWLREQRMERAMALLQAGEVGSVGEAADAVGMRPSYFSRVYRAHWGRTPREDLRG